MTENKIHVVLYKAKKSAMKKYGWLDKYHVDIFKNRENATSFYESLLNSEKYKFLGMFEKEAN